jgi:hypothetical protein
MRPTAVRKTSAWIRTDARGSIRAISSAAHDVLGTPRLGRGDDLLSRFPSLRKALAFDMEVALTGWPTERTIVLEPLSMRPQALRYRVGRSLAADEIELFWILTTESEARVQHA